MSEYLVTEIDPDIAKGVKKSKLQNLNICHFYENSNMMGSFRKYVYQVIYSI